MGTPTAPARCPEHGLVRGPDGACVLCRRSLSPEPARPSRPSLAQRVMSWPPAVKLPGIAGAVSALKRGLPSREPRPEPALGAATSKSPTSAARAASSPVSASTQRARTSPEPPASRPTSLRAALGLSPLPPATIEVVFYALSTCSVCRAAREYMQHRGIPFLERDVERDSAAAADALRLNPRRSVPTFDLGGREVLIGFTPDELEAALLRARPSGTTPARPARRQQ